MNSIKGLKITHMRKRNWLGVFEKNLSFVNEVSAGIGLVIGYALFGLYWLTTPDTTVEVTTQAVVYEESVIGHIPEPQPIQSLSEANSLERNVPVTAKLPRLNENGTPVLQEEVVTFRGKGTPQIVVDHKEIVMPKLVSNKVRVITPYQPDTEANFYLETILQGTGYYYEDKRATFDGVMSADIFAIRIGTLFAFLALVLLLIRVRALPRAVQLVKNLFSPEKGDGFITEDSLANHYKEVEDFKRKYEASKRRAEARYFDLLKNKTDTAYANMTSYMRDVEAYLQSGLDKDEFVLSKDGVAYVEPPIISDLINSEHNNQCLETLNPLDVRAFGKEEAEFFASYLKTHGYPFIKPVRLVKAAKDMLDITSSLKVKMDIYYHGKKKGQDE